MMRLRFAQHILAEFADAGRTLAALREDFFNLLKAPAITEEGYENTREEIIRGTAHCIGELAEAALPLPTSLYRLPDGNIMLEWRRELRYARLEIEHLQGGSLMVSGPLEATVFYEVGWPTT